MTDSHLQFCFHVNPIDFTNTDVGKLVTVFYNQTPEFWTTDDQKRINTPVFSATILDSQSSGARRNLTNPFTYKLQHITETDKEGECVFWSQSPSSAG